MWQSVLPCVATSVVLMGLGCTETSLVAWRTSSQSAIHPAHTFLFCQKRKWSIVRSSQHITQATRRRELSDRESDFLWRADACQTHRTLSISPSLSLSLCLSLSLAPALASSLINVQPWKNTSTRPGTRWSSREAAVSCDPGGGGSADCQKADLSGGAPGPGEMSRHNATFTTLATSSPCAGEPGTQTLVIHQRGCQHTRSYVM